MKWIGRVESIGIGVEATRGVGVAPSYWLNVNSFSFADKPSRALSEAGFGGIWGGDQSPKVLNHAEGEMEVELGDQSFGAILLALLGTVSSTGPTDAVAYTHDFTLQNDNQHDSLSIVTIDPIGQKIFELAMIDSLELQIEPDSIVSANVSFMSKSSADTAGHTASYGAEKKWIGRHLTFKVADDTSGLAAATKVNLKSLTLRFEKNAEVQQVLSTAQPEDICNKRFNITGTIVLNYEDRTWLNIVNDGDYKAVRIDLVGDSLLTGSGTTYPEFKIDLSKVSFEEWEPDFAMDDIVTQTLNFTALYDAGENNNVINDCELVNIVASY